MVPQARSPGPGGARRVRRVHRPYRGVLAYCCQIPGSVTDAGDMLQETLLAAWRVLLAGLFAHG